MNLTKNQQAGVYAAVNAVLVLLGQQLASGQYPIEPVFSGIVQGLIALVVAGLTAMSPFFDWREATR